MSERRTLGLLLVSSLLLVGSSAETKPDRDALSRAARLGLIDVVERLLDEGADASAADTEGWTPLAAARVEGFEEISELLLRRGATDAHWDPAARIDAAIAARLDADTPGIVVLVSRHGEIVYAATVGSANLDGRVPVTEATQFRIGSITKQFTATGILLLEQDGKLRVTDPLSKFIPDYPRGDDVTLHHLLTHTSGIPGYTEKPGFFETVTATTTTEELVESFKQDPLAFEPGTKWAYSNSGYTLLGYIIELVSGSSYGDFLRERIFEPLGLRDTGVHPIGIARHREALGYALTEEGPSLALNWDMSRAAGAGALYSTARDLYRWNEVLFSKAEGRQKLPPSPLSPTTFARALEPARLLPDPTAPQAEPETVGYGHGWGIGRDRGLAVISHSGGLHGFTSSLARYPEAELTVVVLHNAVPSPIQAPTLVRRIAQLYLWQNMEKRPPRRVDPAPDRARWADFTGRYAYGRSIQVVSLRNGRLHAQLTGQSEHEIFPARREPSDRTGEIRFFYGDVYAHLTFVRSASGTVTEVRHHQHGSEADHAKLPARTSANVAPSVLDDYAGDYDFGSGILTLTHKDGALFARMTGQPGAQIFPKSESEFFWKVVDAHIEFVRGAGGRVTHAKYEQGEARVEVPKIR